jgi:hypothetical protein
MKKTWVLLFLLFVSTFTYANHDSSKIYITKNSFINNHADYSSDYFVKEKYWFGWSGFSFQTEGLLRLKLSNGNYKEFSPGSIYGFTTGGIKYIYSSAKNKYFAILSEDKLINFFVGENEKAVYKGLVVDNIFYYSKSIGSDLKIFNKENINRDFNNSEILLPLLNLEAEIHKKSLDKDMHKKQFFQCKKLVEKYLSLD